MKAVEAEVCMKKEGIWTIPAETLCQMNLKSGDNIKLFYMNESGREVKEKNKVCYIVRQSQNAEIASLHIPVELLQDAGIAMDADIDVICAERKIFIMAANVENQKSDYISEELFEIFADLGISKNKAKAVIQSTDTVF
ncbi:MAG: hypothetical protein PHY47_18840 [Lachnospiraceae bacterium]|nr:hypothetical protein [Lachnospiraceae bacterium]